MFKGITRQVRYAGSFAKAGKVRMLDRPIGLVDPPKHDDNDGVDRRSLQQKKEDMLNYDKHMERRKELEYELGKGFDDVRYFRSTGGKFFSAPPAYFRPDKALYMPNIWGSTLTGQNATTTPKLEGNVSIVRIFGAVTGEQQVKSFTEDQTLDNVQIVDVNLQNTALKETLVKLFKFNIKSQVPQSQYDRYFISRKGVTNEIKRAIRAENPFAGYVYLVDPSCRIRWAACGQATVEERANLLKFAQSVRQEAGL